MFYKHNIESKLKKFKVKFKKNEYKLNSKLIKIKISKFKLKNKHAYNL